MVIVGQSVAGDCLQLIQCTPKIKVQVNTRFNHPDQGVNQTNPIETSDMACNTQAVNHY